MQLIPFIPEIILLTRPFSFSILIPVRRPMNEDTDRQPIPYLSPEILSREGFLEETVYPDRNIHYYWSDCWDPAFYIHLARAGFISVAMDHEHLGPLLMPEMQTEYTLLDWENLHVSGHVKKILDRAPLEAQGFSLIPDGNPAGVIRAVREQFGEENWITPSYGRMLGALSLYSCEESFFRLKTVELYEKGELVAGEIGYAIGSTYTSLTGFSSRKREHRNRGSLQLVLLARYLRNEGYAFWNLGHPFMEYKTRLGARILPREGFLVRWFNAIDYNKQVSTFT